MNRLLATTALVAFLAGGPALAQQQSPGMQQQMPGAQQTQPGAQQGTQQRSLSSVLEQQERFSTFAELLEASGLDETLSDGGPYTIFAPTNEAFEQLPSGIADQLTQDENRSTLRNVLSQHVIEGRIITSAELPETMQPLSGDPIEVSMDQGRPALSLDQPGQQQPGQQQPGQQPRAGQQQPGQQAQQQPQAGQQAQQGQLAQQLRQAGADRAQVVTGDIRFENGILHGIDGILVPSDPQQAERR